MGDYNPLISVVVPCFNDPHLLDSLKSLQAQTYQNFEVLLIFDCPTEEYWRDIRKELESFYKEAGWPSKFGVGEIKPPMVWEYVRNVRKPNVCMARNEGLYHSWGDWICFLDSDNTLDPNFFGKALEIARLDRYPGQEKPIQWLIGYPKGQPQFKVDRENLLKLMMSDPIVLLGTTMVSREAMSRIGYFDPRLECGETWWYVIQLLMSDMKFEFFDGSVYCRVWRGALSSRLDEGTIKKSYLSIRQWVWERRKDLTFMPQTYSRDAHP